MIGKQRISSLILINECILVARPDTRRWALETSGEFSCKSFIAHIVHSSTQSTIPLAKLIWKPRGPSKVRTFARTH